MGCNLLALTAGYKPKITPTAIETNAANKIEKTETTKSQS